MPLGDITNCHTPQHKYYKNYDDENENSRSGQNQNDHHISIEPFQNGYNILDI